MISYQRRILRKASKSWAAMGLPNAQNNVRKRVETEGRFSSTKSTVFNLFQK